MSAFALSWQQEIAIYSGGMPRELARLIYEYAMRIVRSWIDEHSAYMMDNGHLHHWDANYWVKKDSPIQLASLILAGDQDAVLTQPEFLFSSDPFAPHEISDGLQRMCATLSPLLLD